MTVPYVTLNNGQKMPKLGLGTWQLAPGEVEKVVEIAIDAGYRHFDCAFLYDNEAEIGSAIRKKIADGVVKREDLFVVTKLWCTCNFKEQVIPSCKKSLENFGLEYLDQYLIHWPITVKSLSEKLNVKDPFGNSIGVDYDFVETWKAMEECVRLGLTKGIGISNFNSKQVERILKAATIKPVVNQVECHPYLNQKRLLEFCMSKGIFLTAYSPLGSPDRPWAQPGEPGLLDDTKLVALAAKYKKSTAQVLLRYQVQRGIVTIPKSVTKSRIEENFKVFDFELSSDDMDYIDTFDRNERFCPMKIALGHPHHPFENDEF
ncbi:hypothetical protein FQR65_LT08481 [Abscondita terminalis]|nr:hypothetical protein FQR65_LT08481 [Abscondita terminalis]